MSLTRRVNGCAGRTLHDFEIQAKQKIRYFISPSNMGRDARTMRNLTFSTQRFVDVLSVLCVVCEALCP